MARPQRRKEDGPLGLGRVSDELSVMGSVTVESRTAAGRVRSPGGATIPSGGRAMMPPPPPRSKEPDGTDDFGREDARWWCCRTASAPGRCWMAITVLSSRRSSFWSILRMLGRSPNTVKSYARALALWWQFLDVYELAWDAVTVEDLGAFLGWLAHRRLAGVGLDRAPVGAVQRGHGRAAPAGGVLVLPLPPLQRRRGRVAAL